LQDCGGSSPLLGTIIQQDGSRKRAIFVLCPEQAKHLRASRQDSKGIRCNGCRGRASVTEPLLGTNNQQDGSRKRTIFVYIQIFQVIQIKTRTALAMRAQLFRQRHLNP
jgi:hypothetical protein